MTETEKFKQLSKVDFLSFLPRTRVKTLCKQCREIAVDEDEVIIQDGAFGDTMYIVLSGEFVVYKKNKVIVKRVPGDYFGEMALIESKPRSASVKAVTKSLVLEITHDQFYSYLATNSKILLTLLKTLSNRSRKDLQTLDQGYEQLHIEKEDSVRLRQILDDTSNEIYVFDSESFLFQQANQTAHQNLGYTKDEICKLTPYDIIEGLTPETLRSMTEPLLSGKKTLLVMDFILKRKNGTTYPVEIRLQLLETKTTPFIVAMVQDNTVRREMEEKIKHLAFYDSLTDLPNRNLLNDRLNMVLAQARRNKTSAGIMLLDLDNFKLVNDSLGHQGGDKLLQLVSQRLKSCLRAEDTIGRMGGDEFVVIIPKVNYKQDTFELAKKIIDQFKDPFTINEHELYSSCSIGIAFFPDDGEESKTLLKNADAAMYQAKEEGKNKYELYLPALSIKSQEKMQLTNDLHRALERNEFSLYYQPKVDLQTDRVIGMEALLRWNHPQMGLMLPEQFLHILEESTLIIPVGEWALRAACRQMMEWKNQGLAPMNVSVNLSGSQLNRKELPEFIDSIIGQTGVNPENLEMEITEHVLIKDADSSMKTLNQLKEIGVKLTIDDFGTKYSSLNYLRNLPVQTLKIDKSFIGTGSDSVVNEPVTKAIVSLAQSLDLKAIAEGVETQTQKQFLRSIQCDAMQGFLFSRPVPADAATKLYSHDPNYLIQ